MASEANHLYRLIRTPRVNRLPGLPRPTWLHLRHAFATKDAFSPPVSGVSVGGRIMPNPGPEK